MKYYLNKINKLIHQEKRKQKSHAWIFGAGGGDQNKLHLPFHVSSFLSPPYLSLTINITTSLPPSPPLLFSPPSLSLNSKRKKTPVRLKKEMGDNNFNMPPGFRFYPSDEELVVHFLHRKAALLPCHPDVIPDLDLYPYDPWDLDGRI